MTTQIGLDIGTSAVRAAQVASGKDSASLLAFGQVAIPPGAVVDGEIRDPGIVTQAVADLWKRTKLKSKTAVIGLANQRVVVRQVDFPVQPESEFRAALRFQIADQIPMSIDDAELDFQIIGEFTNPSGEQMMRVLLVAAARDMVATFMSVVTGAGLQPAGIDLSPFAVARALSPVARREMGLGGAEAIIDIGAGVTNIVVHHNGEPKFVRILLVGGNDATDALASSMGVSFNEAEALKFDIARGVGSAEVHQVIAQRVDSLVDEIRGSLDYYLSQEDSEQLISILVTGGGSMTPGLVQRLEAVMRQPVHMGAPLSQMDVSKSGLSQEQLVQIQVVTGTSIGLAMGSGRR